MFLFLNTFLFPSLRLILVYQSAELCFRTLFLFVCCELQSVSLFSWITSGLHHVVNPQRLCSLSLFLITDRETCWRTFWTCCAVIRGFSFSPTCAPAFLRMYPTVDLGKHTNFDIPDGWLLFSFSLTLARLPLPSSTKPQYKWKLSINSELRVSSLVHELMWKWPNAAQKIFSSQVSN